MGNDFTEFITVKGMFINGTVIQISYAISFHEDDFQALKESGLKRMIKDSKAITIGLKPMKACSGTRG